MLLPLEPLVDVALDPVVDVPVEPTTGALGARGALLGAVLPVEVLGGLPSPNGAILGNSAGPGGRTPSRRTPASPGGSLLARHCLMNLLFCWPIRSISSRRARSALFSSHLRFFLRQLKPFLPTSSKPRPLPKEQMPKQLLSS